MIVGELLDFPGGEIAMRDGCVRFYWTLPVN
jgi:hypothetical protein